MYRKELLKHIVAVLILSFTLGFLAEDALSAEKSLAVGLWTQHFGGEEHTEGISNRLIALEYNHAMVAWFKNSYGKETVLVGGALHTDKYELAKDWWTRANLYGGIMVGYGDENPARLGPFSLGVFPTASLGYKAYSLELGAAPNMCFLSLRVEF